MVDVPKANTAQFQSNIDERDFTTTNNELLHQESKRSNFISFIYLLKGFLGMGFYMLPYSFVNGYDAGVTFIISVVIYGVCLYFLVNVSQQVGGNLSYPETVEAMCFNCLKTEKIAKAASIFTQILLVLNAFLLCSLYIGFITSHVERVVSYNKGEYVNYNEWLLILTIPLLLLCIIPCLRIFAIIGLLFELLTIFIFYGAFVIADFPSEVGIRISLFSNHFLRVLFSGLMTFFLEGVGIVLVVENSMKYPKNMIGCPSLLCAVILIAFIINLICAVIAFVRFGSLTKLFVTLSTPSFNDLGQTTLIFAALSIYFTYPIQFNVGFMVLWNPIKRVINVKVQKLIECIFRVLLVMATSGIALINPDNAMCHIITHGGFFFILLGVIIPILLQMCWWYSNSPGYGKYYWRFIILLIGLIGYCSYLFTIISLTFYYCFNSKTQKFFEM